MNPGKLRHRIEIQEFKTKVDSGGFASKQWQTIARPWAAVNGLYGKEFYEASAVQMQNTVKFKIRYRKGFDNSMRILFRGDYYEIIHIDNIRFANTEMEIKTVLIQPETPAEKPEGAEPI